MLLSLILFGSRARGDHRVASDVDLLGVVDGGAIKEEVASRGTSFYRYPIETLRSKAADGDLFTLHLSLEGKVLHDTASVFASVCEAFRFKESYNDEIREASAVIYFLLSRRQFLETRPSRKRLIWGIRTILIARSAEQRTPAFSSSALSKFSDCGELKNIIDKRYSLETTALINIAEQIVDKFGTPPADLDWPLDPIEQVALLTNIGRVAKSMVESSKRASRTKRAQDSASDVSFYI